MSVNVQAHNLTEGTAPNPKLGNRSANVKGGWEHAESHHIPRQPPSNKQISKQHQTNDQKTTIILNSGCRFY